MHPITCFMLPCPSLFWLALRAVMRFHTIAVLSADTESAILPDG